MIETRRIGSNCADVGFCRIKGADQCEQHKKRSACQRSYAASAGTSHDIGNDILSRQRARPRRGTSSQEQVLTTSGAARSRGAPFQVLSREARQEPFVDHSRGRQPRIFPRPKAPQPDQDVHGCAPNSGLLLIIVRHGKSVQCD
jgi:hypothetical protein